MRHTNSAYTHNLSANKGFVHTVFIMNFCHEKFKLSRRVKKKESLHFFFSFFFFYIYVYQCEIWDRHHISFHLTLYTIFSFCDRFASLTLYWQLRYGYRRGRKDDRSNGIAIKKNQLAFGFVFLCLYGGGCGFLGNITSI